MLLLVTVTLALMPQMSLSLPKVPPVNCKGNVAGSCTYPKVYPNTTGIIMAPATGSGVFADGGATAVRDSLGSVWQRDYCANGNGGDCLWHTNFSSAIPWYGWSDTITISPNYYNSQGYDSFLFLYDGTWTFTGKASQGSYREVAPFSDCPVNGTCPYSWTGMVYGEAGEMGISWSNSRIPISAGFVPKANLGYSIEATDNTFAIEDMIFPVEGIYIGSLLWKNPDGVNGGGSHWQMGLAVYRRTQ